MPNYKGNKHGHTIVIHLVQRVLCTAVGLATGLGRCLGMRSQGMKCALHDPLADGALVLYTPSELTAHEKFTVDK